jgi:hypothetical protein
MVSLWRFLPFFPELKRYHRPLKYEVNIKIEHAFLSKKY